MTDQSQMKDSESWGSDSTAVRKLSVFPLMFFVLYHTGSSQIRLVGFIHSCIQQILFENTAENQTKPCPHGAYTQEVKRRHLHKQTIRDRSHSDSQ